MHLPWKACYSPGAWLGIQGNTWSERVQCRTPNPFHTWTYMENRVGKWKLPRWNIYNSPFKSKCFFLDLKGLFCETFGKWNIISDPDQGALGVKVCESNPPLSLHFKLEVKASQGFKQKVSLWMKRNLILSRMSIFMCSHLPWMGKIFNLSSKNCFYIQQGPHVQNIPVL